MIWLNWDKVGIVCGSCHAASCGGGGVSIALFVVCVCVWGRAQSCWEASFSFSCLEGVLAAALQNFHLCFYVSSVRFTRLRRIKSLEH